MFNLRMFDISLYLILEKPYETLKKILDEENLQKRGGGCLEKNRKMQERWVVQGDGSTKCLRFRDTRQGWLHGVRTPECTLYTLCSAVYSTIYFLSKIQPYSKNNHTFILVYSWKISPWLFQFFQKKIFLTNIKGRYFFPWNLISIIQSNQIILINYTRTS